MKQARVAVDLAKRAGAAEFAPRELADAEKLLDDTINAVEAKTAKETVMVMAHDTVRKALKSQIRAEEQSFQAALDAERAENAAEIGQLETSIASARSEAEKERYLAEQRQMKLEMEQRARSEAEQQAAEAARLAAEEAAKRARAEQDASMARQQAQNLASEKHQAEADAAAARREREAARERLQIALSAVAETRETARGLIVNLPDILFEFNQSELKPQAREVLSKICGILSVTDAYNLKLEGHTDSVGSDQYNQTLSDRRAGSVDNYLSTCGLDGKIVAVKGFGESKPVASNDTAEGRQKNRRVELVIEDKPATLSSLTNP
jgi:outer membrane protein OmpA-like peptidoglycan-associated protein